MIITHMDDEHRLDRTKCHRHQYPDLVHSSTRRRNTRIPQVAIGLWRLRLTLNLYVIEPWLLYLVVDHTPTPATIVVHAHDTAHKAPLMTGVAPRVRVRAHGVCAMRNGAHV